MPPRMTAYPKEAFKFKSQKVNPANKPSTKRINKKDLIQSADPQILDQAEESIQSRFFKEKLIEFQLPVEKLRIEAEN